MNEWTFEESDIDSEVSNTFNMYSRNYHYTHTHSIVCVWLYQILALLDIPVYLRKSTLTTF